MILRRLSCLLLLAPALAGCGGGDSSAPGGSGGFPDAAYSTVKSDSGALTIEVRTAPEQPPTRGVLDVEYTIRDDHGPRDDLEVTVVPWMIAMGHGASTKPSVHPRGGGVYDLSDVDCFMPGTWELRTTIAGGANDHATPTLDVR